MTVTLLGIAFVLAYAISARWGRRGIATVMLFAVPFFDSAALNVGAVSLSPYYVGAIAFATWVVVALLRGEDAMITVGPLAGLVAYSLVLTCIIPGMLGGLPVIVAGVGLDQQANSPSPLTYTSSNLAQSAYLLLNAVFVMGTIRRQLLSLRVIDASLMTGLVAALSFWFATKLGLPWLTEFFHNSDRGFYTTETDRLSGQFSEPSHLGVFSAVALCYFVARLLSRVENRGVIVAASGVVAAGFCFVLSRSGTGIAGVAITSVVLILVAIAAALRARFALHVPVGVGMMAVVSFPFFLLLLPVIGMRTLADLNEVKEATSSSANRAFADGHAIDVLASTAGLGAGLGSNRSSSLLTLLLSNVGLPGTILFAIVCVLAIAKAWRTIVARPAAIALITYLGAAIVSFADFANPLLWVFIAACWQDWPLQGSAKSIGGPRIYRLRQPVKSSIRAALP